MLIGHTTRRNAAVQAARSIAEQATILNTQSDNSDDDQVFQVDGCYKTPDTSANTSTNATGTSITIPKKSETVDNFLDDEAEPNSLTWDMFHDQAMNDNLAEDHNYHALFKKAEVVPSTLELQYQHGKNQDLNRVYTFHGALPIRSTPINFIPDTARLQRIEDEESEEESNQGKRKKRKKMRNFLNRIRHHGGGRDRDHDGGGPRSGPRKMVSQ